jgi:Fic family protein
VEGIQPLTKIEFNTTILKNGTCTNFSFLVDGTKNQDSIFETKNQDSVIETENQDWIVRTESQKLPIQTENLEGATRIKNLEGVTRIKNLEGIIGTKNCTIRSRIKNMLSIEIQIRSKKTKFLT